MSVGCGEKNPLLTGRGLNLFFPLPMGRLKGWLEDRQTPEGEAKLCDGWKTPFPLEVVRHSQIHRPLIYQAAKRKTKVSLLSPKSHMRDSGGGWWWCPVERRTSCRIPWQLQYWLQRKARTISLFKVFMSANWEQHKFGPLSCFSSFIYKTSLVTNHRQAQYDSRVLRCTSSQNSICANTTGSSRLQHSLARQDKWVQAAKPRNTTILYAHM